MLSKPYYHIETYEKRYSTWFWTAAGGTAVVAVRATRSARVVRRAVLGDVVSRPDHPPFRPGYAGGLQRRGFRAHVVTNLTIEV